MSDAILKTKWGNAKVDNHGYYQITSAKYGKNGERLHRVIFEDFYGEIPKGYVIHHKDGDKLNNCIMNLQLLSDSEHKSLHHKGKKYALGVKRSIETRQKMSDAHKGIPKSEEHKDNLSKSRNTLGYLRVCKKPNKSCKQGFTYHYEYSEEGKQKAITSVSLEKLEKKVKARGLKWLKLEMEA